MYRFIYLSLSLSLSQRPVRRSHACAHTREYSRTQQHFLPGGGEEFAVDIHRRYARYHVMFITCMHNHKA